MIIANGSKRLQVFFILSDELLFYDEHNPPHLSPLPPGERDRVRGTFVASSRDISVCLEALNIMELLYVSPIILITFCAARNLHMHEFQHARGASSTYFALTGLMQ
jgi:hypothetical protein